MKIGRIYKIISNQGIEIYVGSTFNELRYRFSSHKCDYRRWLDGRRRLENNLSVFKLFDKYGIEGCSIVLVKAYDVIDRAHLEVYETLWIKKLKAMNDREPLNGEVLDG